MIWCWPSATLGFKRKSQTFEFLCRCYFTTCVLVSSYVDLSTNLYIPWWRHVRTIVGHLITLTLQYDESDQSVRCGSWSNSKFASGFFFFCNLFYFLKMLMALTHSFNVYFLFKYWALDQALIFAHYLCYLLWTAKWVFSIGLFVKNSCPAGGY